MLDARGAQAGEAVAVDGGLPVEEFFDGERVALARLFEAQDDMGIFLLASLILNVS